MELRRGDYFTWQVTLEGRAGALCGESKICPVCVCILPHKQHVEPVLLYMLINTYSVSLGQTGTMFFIQVTFAKESTIN